MFFAKKTPASGATDSQAFLASIISSSEDAIEALTLEGNVLVWNRGCEELYGYTEVDMSGKSALSIYPEGRAD